MVVLHVDNIDAFICSSLMRLCVPHFYSSHSVPSFNIQETAYRRCVKNPKPSNLQKLETTRVSLQQSIEIDRVCYINGSKNASLQEKLQLSS